MCVCVCVCARACVCVCVCDSRMSQGPFTYEALPPDEITFVPLKQTREFKASDLMQVSTDAPTHTRTHVLPGHIKLIRRRRGSA